jgi:hypothetical protein
MMNFLVILKLTKFADCSYQHQTVRMRMKINVGVRISFTDIRTNVLAIHTTMNRLFCN